MTFSPEQSKNNDYFAKDLKGDLIVSDNNREQDIAFYFDHIDNIKAEFVACLEISTLSDQSKEIAEQIFFKEIRNIQEEASSLAKSQRDKHQIRFGLIEGLLDKGKRVIVDDKDRKELEEVIKVFNGSLFEMIQGDKVFDYLSAKK